MQNNCREIPQKKHVAPTFWKQLKMPIFKFFFFFFDMPIFKFLCMQCMCWCKHNDNGNKSKRTLVLSKEIQAIGWLNFHF